MKKIFVCAGAACALAIGFNAASISADKAEQTRDVADFSAVNLRGSMDIEVKVGGKKSVRVVADADYIDRVETYVDNGTLNVEMEKGSYRNLGTIKVYVTVPSLTAAGLYGSGDLKVDGAKADDFEFTLKGSGDGYLVDSNVKKLTLDLAGSGDITARGTCETAEIDLKGSGDIEAHRMECKDVEVTLKGSGDISAYASESADATLTGSGDITLAGNPKKVKSKARGSGDLTID